MIDDQRYIDIPQRTPDGTANPEWLAMRSGLLTSSKIHAIRPPAKLTKKDGTPRKIQELESRRKLKRDLVFERETGLTMPGYKDEWIQRGIEMEDTAVMAYQFKMDVEILRIGFVLHPSIGMAGASWDGYIPEKRRLVEIKCPAPHTHWQYLISGEIPAQYLAQMNWQLACEPEMEANDFVSYCPMMRPEHQLFIRRLNRDNAVIAAMEAEATKFLAEVDQAVLEFRERMKILPKYL